MGLFLRSFATTLFVVYAVHYAQCYRLPETVFPTHYDLEILTNLDGEFDFHGKVSIQIYVKKSANNITLHSKNLTIHNADVQLEKLSEKTPVKLKDIKLDESNDFLIIFTEDPLTEGVNYVLTVPFKGVLETGLDGYYKSGYVDKATGEQRWLGVTQFEAIAARKAFPCFDEPAMKATFNITLGRHQNYTAVSNMPLEKTEPIKDKKDWFWDTFEKSVPMSTYLVAFMVSDFGYKQSEPCENNVTFRIWSRKDALDQVDFAKETGPRALRFFEKFFDIEYPLPKVDMVALPDFNAGAMENWGLVTFREAYLLHDPSKSSLYSKESVASVISHELAHQWFGNLVTMEWWTDLWLNEGFATYMATVAVDKLFPEFHVLDEESANDLVAVFKLDSLKSSHPVSVPIGHPRDIDQIFDTISYKKGSMLIRMMAIFLGEDVLRRGVTNYLLKHKYKNAHQDDLWQALTEEAHKTKALPEKMSVKEIMDTWTLQTGYPVIQVSRNYEQNTVEVSQQRYLKDTKNKEEFAAQCWWIPLSFTTETQKNFNNTKPSHWLNCKEKKELIERLPGKDEWVVFNIKGAGLYRVNYDDRNWNLLIDTLNSDKYTDIDSFNRIQLIEDSASLAWTSHITYDVFFNIIKYLERETEFLPWDVALSKISILQNLLIRTPIYGKFEHYMKTLLEKPYKKYGGMTVTPEAKNNAVLLKKQILLSGIACRYRVQSCIDDAVAMFKNMKENNVTVPTDLRKTIYCMGIRYGTVEDWNYLWNIYLKSNNPNEKSHVMYTLGCTQEIWLLQKYLMKIIEDNSGIRKQDAESVFNAVINNPVGFYVAKTFFEDHIVDINKNIGKSRRFAKYVSVIGQRLITKTQVDAFANFTKQHETILLDAKQVVEQTLETAMLNVQWHNSHYEHIKNILKNY